jgi:hypothetical protein
MSEFLRELVETEKAKRQKKLLKKIVDVHYAYSRTQG